MKSRIMRIVGFSLSTVLVCTALLFASSTLRAHAASSSATISPTASTGTPSWITKASPYVHVVNYTATIDPAISQILNSAELAQAKQAVQKYNSLPISAKKPVTLRVTLKSSNMRVLANSSCSASGVIAHNVYWWGNAYTLDNCLIQTLWFYEYVDGSTAAAAAAICGFLSAGLCAVVEGLTAVAIASYISALQGADSQCGNEGANLNFPWEGPPFVNAIC